MLLGVAVALGRPSSGTASSANCGNLLQVGTCTAAPIVLYARKHTKARGRVYLSGLLLGTVRRCTNCGALAGGSRDPSVVPELFLVRPKAFLRSRPPAVLVSSNRMA